MLLPSLLVSLQVDGPADLDPELPPTAAVPVFVDMAAPGGDQPPSVADQGTGRGQIWVDIVGPSLEGSPELPGPPDGVLDLVQFNSNSPALPLGASGGPDGIPSVGSSSSPTRVYRRETDGTLLELGGAMSEPGAGLSLAYPGGSPWGAAAGDLDGDGFVDLVVACGGFNVDSPNGILLANGDGTFRYTTPASAPRQASFTPAIFDADRDGDLDLWIGNGAAGQFVGWVGNQGVAATDRFYTNDGLGGLTPAEQEAGLALDSNSFSAVTTDLDLDGNIDIVIACFKQYNKLFYNRGDGTFAFMRPDDSLAGPPLSFTDMVPDPAFAGTVDFSNAQIAQLGSQPIRPLWSMPVDSGDFNGDGWTDLFFGAWSNQLLDDDPDSSVGSKFMPYERAFLYLNLGDQNGDGLGEGRFREAAVETGIAHIGGTMGAIVGDFSGDGFPDVYVGGGGPDFDRHVEEDFFYVNEPTSWPADFLVAPTQPLPKAFWEVGAVAGTYINREMSHGVNAEPGADGRLDLVVGNGGPAVDDQGQANRYFDNQGDSTGAPFTGWTVALAPTVSSTRAVGARVELVRDFGGGPGQTVIGELRATHAFSSQRLGDLIIPTGGVPVAFANVTWPSGTRSGLHLWPTGGASGQLALSEPDTSIRIRTSALAGGDVRLAIRAENVGTEPFSGSLVLAILVQGPVGLQFPIFVQVNPSLQLAAGQEFEVEADFASLPRGLYAAILVGNDPLGIENEHASWWDGLTPGSSGNDDSTYSDDSSSRRLWTANRTLELSSERVRVIPQDHEREATDLLFRGSGRHETPTGDVLAWDESGVMFSTGVRPLQIQLDSDGLFTVLAGGAASCCDQRPTEPPTLFQFRGVEPKSIAVDGQPLF